MGCENSNFDLCYLLCIVGEQVHCTEVVLVKDLRQDFGSELKICINNMIKIN